MLLAHPGMRDPNFEKTVVFLSMHDAENGSFGVVLNRPSGKRLNELITDQDLGCLSMAPVYFGGPVGNDQLLLAAFRWQPDLVVGGGTWAWRHDLTVETAAELVQQEGTIIRVFAGYSGWSKGQLQKELEGGTWVVHRPGDELLEPDALPGLWRKLVRSHGPVYQFLTDIPDALGNN